NPYLSIYRTSDGVVFDLMSTSPVQFTLQPADPLLTRIDIIVATLGDSIPSASQSRHYRQSPPNPGQPEGDVQVFPELWDQLTLQVITGVASNAPVAPAVPAGSEPLWAITVPPATTVLAQTMIADLRFGANSQVLQDQLINSLQGQVNL